MFETAGAPSLVSQYMYHTNSYTRGRSIFFFAQDTRPRASFSFSCMSGSILLQSNSTRI